MVYDFFLLARNIPEYYFLCNAVKNDNGLQISDRFCTWNSHGVHKKLKTRNTNDSLFLLEPYTWINNPRATSEERKKWKNSPEGKAVAGSFGSLIAICVAFIMYMKKWTLNDLVCFFFYSQVLSPLIRILYRRLFCTANGNIDGYVFSL